MVVAVALVVAVVVRGSDSGSSIRLEFIVNVFSFTINWGHSYK